MAREVEVPEFVAEEELCQYLADLFHESASPAHPQAFQLKPISVLYVSHRHPSARKAKRPHQCIGGIMCQGTKISAPPLNRCVRRHEKNMGKQFDQITPDLARWLGQQRLFFVATAPLAPDGLVNCSPKGMDTFRIVGPKEVAYLDLTGSGIETTAHLRENGRIVFMFCAFSGPPKIVRLHGTGEVIPSHNVGFEALRALFPAYPGARSVIRATLHRISDSCGYAAPRFEYAGERDTLARWADSKGPAGLVSYRAKNNLRSLDGLPGLEPESQR